MGALKAKNGTVYLLLVSVIEFNNESAGRIMAVGENIYNHQFFKVDLSNNCSGFLKVFQTFSVRSLYLIIFKAIFYLLSHLL